MQHVVRQYFFQRLLQQVLGDSFSIFVDVRQLPDKIHELHVKKRRAHFQRVHHAGAVDLDKNVVLQIKLGIKLQGLVDEIRLPARVPLLDGFRIDLFEIDRLLEQLRKLPRIERTHPYREPKALRITQSAE